MQLIHIQVISETHTQLRFCDHGLCFKSFNCGCVSDSGGFRGSDWASLGGRGVREDADRVGGGGADAVPGGGEGRQSEGYGGVLRQSGGDV